MAKTQRMGIRLSQEERQQIQEAVRRLEYKGPSALVRQAIHNELVGRSSAATDSGSV
jgi:Arc/MetJ-type ribon-helix-helix transcriptional regulator